MDEFELRAQQARELWRAGDRAMAAHSYGEAWRRYTQAHDLVTDCAELHREAHRRLLAVNRLNGHRGERLTDRILLVLAPLGVFEVLAILFRSKVADREQCRRLPA